MNDRYVPINKGNYSMDTTDREEKFEENRGLGWEVEYKLYREQWSENAKNQIVGDYPLLVDIELSSLCNLKCPMCYTISDEFKEKVNITRMDFILYKSIIDQIAGKVPAIRLSLRGEATLHKNFVECIKYAKDRGIKEVSTLTHGGTLQLDNFKKMAAAGIDWITISVDGIGETYNNIRKPLKFNKILDNIKKINEFKKQNNLRRPVIKVQGIWPAISQSPDEYYKTLAPFVDLVAFNPLIDYLGNDTNIEYLEKFTCPQQYQRLVIGADGLVMKCSNDEENKELVGDVNKQSVHEIWHGEELKNIRELHKTDRGFLQSSVCKKCYLPRKTSDEAAEINGRSFFVKNYTFRIQEVGK